MTSELERIATALERIASALEGERTIMAPISLTLDGKSIANAVVKQTLIRAGSGPSSLVGGALVTGKEYEHERD